MAEQAKRADVIRASIEITETAMDQNRDQDGNPRSVRQRL